MTDAITLPRSELQAVLDAYNKYDYTRFPTVKAFEAAMLAIRARLASERINPHDLYTDVVSDGGMDPRNTQEEKPEATTVDKAIENLRDPWRRHEEKAFTPDWDAMAALTEEIQRMAKRIEELEGEQEEKPEPVAWAHWDSPSWSEEPITLTVITKPPTKLQKESANWFPLYTAPPKREWQGLTDEEIHRAYQAWFNSESKHERDFVRAIEAKLKEKNDG